MRRTLLLLATILYIIALSCCTHKELETIIDDNETELVQLTVKARIGDTDNTKTAVQENGTSIYWSVGDAINLFYGNKSSGQFTSDLSEPSASADFNGTISVATGTTEIGGSAQSFWGVYPYNVANMCDGTGVVITLPSTQSGVPNTFANNLNPTVAKSSGLDLAFYNVGSWFLFSVTQENVASATLSGNNNEDLAGTIRVSMDANSRPVAEVQEGAKSITITPLEGDSFAVGEIYYMVLLPQTLTNGYTLTLTKTDGSTADCIVGTSAEFVRSSFRRKRNADNGLYYIPVGNISFADDNVKAICVANWDTNDDGELSYAEAAAVTTIPYSAFANNTTITSFDEFQYFYGVTTLEYDSEYDEGWDYFGTFYHCTSLASITLPPTLKNISYACFRDCSALTSITIPASVTTIQMSAFLGCTNLDVYMESETPCALQKDTYGTYAEPYAFGFLTSGKVKTIYVPTEESVAVYKAATYWSSYASIIKWVNAIPVPEAVDLGLSVKWASFNLGASAPEERGDFYAWGEVEPYYASFEPLTWKEGKEAGYMPASYSFYYGNPSAITKYNTKEEDGIVDNLTQLELADDAANYNLKGSWRIPTDEEWNELMDSNNCTWTYTTLNGVYGYRVTSKKSGFKSHSVFIPLTGIFSTEDGLTFYPTSKRGNYWSSTLNSGNPYSVWFARVWEYNTLSKEGYDRINLGGRVAGYSIRPVTTE